jgi:hypothetical protein
VNVDAPPPFFGGSRGRMKRGMHSNKERARDFCYYYLLKRTHNLIVNSNAATTTTSCRGRKRSKREEEDGDGIDFLLWVRGKKRHKSGNYLYLGPD